MSVTEQNMSGARLAAFDATLDNGKLYVDIAKLATANTVNFFRDTLGTNDFTVHQARIGREKRGLVVTGTTSVFGNENVAVKIVTQSGPGGDVFLHFAPGPDSLIFPAGTATDSLLQHLEFVAQELVVTAPGNPAHAPTITQRGSLPVLGLAAVDVSQEWNADRCTVRWHAPKTMQIAGIEQLSIDAFSIDFSASVADTRFDGLVRGEIHVGEFVLPVKMPLPAGGDAIQLLGDFPPTKLLGNGELGAMLGTEKLPDELSNALDNIGTLAISNIEVLFNPAVGSIPYLTVELVAANTWQLLTDIFEVRETKIELTLFAPARKDRSLEVSVSGEIAIGNTSVLVYGHIAEATVLYGSIQQLSLRQLVRSLLPQYAQADALPDIALSDLSLVLSSSGDFNVSANSARLSIDAIAESLGIALPDNLSGALIDRLSLSRDATSGSTRLQLSSATSLRITDNATAAKISDVAIDLRYNPSTGTTISSRFVINGDTDICRELSLHFDAVTFDWDQRKACWSVDGDVVAGLLGNDYQFQASVESRGDGNAISLKYPNELELSEIGGTGTISIRNLAIFTEKYVTDEQVSQRWGVSGATRIAATSLFDASGRISLQSGDDGTQLQLSARAPHIAPIALPLDLPSSPVLHLSLGELTARFTSDRKKTREWLLTASAQMQIHHIPDLLKSYLPTEVLNGYLHADQRALKLGFDVPATLQPEFPELALTFSNDTTLSLGKPELRVDAIELQLGEETKLIQRINATLPPQLNRLFGSDDSGHPNLDLFNSNFDLGLELAKKPTLKAITSPLKPLEFYQKDYIDGQWTLWDFGAVGKVEFRVPEFSFANGRWSASGGFNRLTDISLPLKPIKFMLDKCGFPTALTTPLPNALPLKDVDLTGDNFAAEMKSLLGDDVLDQLDKRASTILGELFDRIKSFIDRLPSRLQDYLQIRIPKSVLFDISVDAAGGGTSIALRTLPDDPPLRFLFPMMLGIPELMGISLRGFSLGQKMGGALALVEIDGHIDRFDMVSLSGALALNKDIANRYYLEETTFVVPTGLPVPIPLFFSKLGLDYLDILGLNIQARWSYPNPHLGVFDSINLFSDLLSFFQQRDYLLHKEGFGETLGLQLTVGKNFIALPDYLGGQTLGLTEALPTLSVGDSIARFLDFLKTGNSAYAITAIPLQHDGQWIRLGSEDIHFGPLSLGMSWCVTTEREFIDVIVPASHYHGNLPVEFDDTTLKSLPTKDTTPAGDKGFVILLSGMAELGRIVGVRTEFGIIASARGGFETGFRMIAEMGRTLSLEIKGTLEASDKLVAISGHTGIYWNEKTIAATRGRIAVSDEALEVDIKIDLSPAFNIQGKLRIGKNGFLMDGKAAWGHGADGPSEGIGASIRFSAEGMTIGFDWRLLSFDAQVEIHVPGNDERQFFSARVVLQPDSALQQLFAQGITSVAKSAAENSVDKVFNDLQAAIADVDSLDVSIGGLRNWLPRVCDDAVSAITNSINANTNGWKRPGRGPAHKIARPYIERLNALRDGAKNAPDDTFRAELKTALADIVKNNHLKVRVGSPAVRWKKNKWGIKYPSYYTRYFTVFRQDLMDGAQLNQLKQAIANIDRLPARKSIRIDAQKLYDQLPGRDKLLAKINHQISSGMSDAVPKIESIAFQTSLELVDTGKLDATVAYSRAGNYRVAHATLDISNPVTTSAQLVEAFC